MKDWGWRTVARHIGNRCSVSSRPGSTRASRVSEDRHSIAWIAACDVYTWKLFRRDMGRSRSESEALVRQIVSGILGGGGEMARGSHS